MFVEVTDGTGKPLGILPMSAIGAISPPKNDSKKGAVMTVQNQVCFTRLDYDELLPILCCYGKKLIMNHTANPFDLSAMRKH